MKRGKRKLGRENWEGEGKVNGKGSVEADKRGKRRKEKGERQRRRGKGKEKRGKGRWGEGKGSKGEGGGGELKRAQRAGEEKEVEEAGRE